jgi:hypothetical protein
MVKAMGYLVEIQRVHEFGMAGDGSDEGPLSPQAAVV